MKKHWLLFWIFMLISLILVSRVSVGPFQYPNQFPAGYTHTLNFGDLVLSSDRTTYVISQSQTHRGQIVSAYQNHDPYTIIESFSSLVNRSTLSGQHIEPLIEDDWVVGVRIEYEDPIPGVLSVHTEYRFSLESEALEVHTFFKNRSEKPIETIAFQQNLSFPMISPRLLRSRMSDRNFIYIQEEGISHGILPVESGVRVSLKSNYGIVFYPNFSLEPYQQTKRSLLWFVGEDAHTFYSALIDQYGIPFQEVQGVITDTEGTGYPYVEVRAFEANATTLIGLTRSDETGAYRFFLPEGPYVIDIDRSGLTPVSQRGLDFIITPPQQNAFLWGPFLTDVRSDGIAIQWKSLYASPATLELYDEESSKVHRYEIPQRKTISRIILYDDDRDPAHSIKPDTRYQYEVVLHDSVAPGLSSPRYSFQTMPTHPETFTFLVYGDSQRNDDLHRIVTLSMGKEQPSFVIHTGDLVNNGNHMPDWDNYFDAKRLLAAHVAYFPVLGNHEYNNPVYYEAYHLPMGGGDFNKRWYSFSFGDLFFIQLDSCVEQEAMRIEQTRWLEEQLQTHEHMPIKIVSFHHPFWTNHPRRYYEESLHEKDWRPLFEKFGVSIVFNGHIHSYERFVRNGITYVISGGGGGPLDSQTGPNFHSFTQTALTGYLHYVRVDVSEKGLDLQVKAVMRATDPMDPLSVLPHTAILDRFFIWREDLK